MLSREERLARNRAYRALWRTKNREQIRNYAREWHRAHPGYNLARTREWLKDPKNYARHRQNILRSKYKRDFGITIADYEEMLAAQNGVCVICRRPPQRERLHVDHDHKTKKNRGLLCGACNRALGLLHDKPELFEKAAEYLRKHSDVSS